MLHLKVPEYHAVLVITAFTEGDARVKGPSFLALELLTVQSLL